LVKRILILLLLPVSVFAQEFGQVQIATADISLYQYTDSATLFELPANVELKSLTMICDTAFTAGETDSIKVGIQGEDAPSSNSFRFGDLKHDSLKAGESLSLSHYTSRQQVAGKLYAYETELVVACADADTYYPITGLRAFEITHVGQGWSTKDNFDTSVTQAALIARKYRGGWYRANIGMSFYGSKANIVAHGEIYLDTDGWDYITFEEAIASASNTHTASASGGVYIADGDSVRFMLKSDAASTNYTVTHGQLVLQKYEDRTPYRTGSEPKNIMLYCRATTGRFRFVVEYVTFP